jgi:hypothetical protein
VWTALVREIGTFVCIFCVVEAGTQEGPKMELHPWKYMKGKRKTKEWKEKVGKVTKRRCFNCKCYTDV